MGLRIVFIGRCPTFQFVDVSEIGGDACDIARRFALLFWRDTGQDLALPAEKKCMQHLGIRRCNQHLILHKLVLPPGCIPDCGDQPLLAILKRRKLAENGLNPLSTTKRFSDSPAARVISIISTETSAITPTPCLATPKGRLQTFTEFWEIMRGPPLVEVMRLKALPIDFIDQFVPPRCGRGLKTLTVGGSCWIPGSWMYRCRTTRFLSPSPPRIPYFSTALKMSSESRTRLEHKTPESNKSV